MEVCEFVNFSIAKKLKEKGFREQCLFHWNDGKFLCNTTASHGMLITTDLMMSCNNLVEQFDVKHEHIVCDAPTIAQALKWLREEKKIHIVIDITNYGFISSIISFKWDKSYCENEIENYDHKGYSTYEEAALAGIEYVLNNLI